METIAKAIKQGEIAIADVDTSEIKSRKDQDEVQNDGKVRKGLYTCASIL